MSGAMREKTQADFDMDRFIDMFDEAMTSSDPRVIETLRKLMMIVALTRPEDRSHSIDRRTGPLRQMYDDVKVAHRRISDLEDTVKMVMNNQEEIKYKDWPNTQAKYKMMAAAQMAQEIDQDVLNQIKSRAKGLNVIPPAGKLHK